MRFEDLPGRAERRVKLGLVIRQEHDVERALLVLAECGPGDGGQPTIARGELHFYRARSDELNAVVHRSAGGETVGSKTGARVVHFKQLDVRAGAVLNGELDVLRTAAGCERKRKRGENWRQRAELHS